MRVLEIRKESIGIFLIVFSYFAGNYTDFIIGLGLFLKIISNVAFIYMLIDILNNVIKSGNFNRYTGIANGYTLFTIVYIIICMENSNAQGVFSYIKSIVLILWIDKMINRDKTLLEDPIRLAFYCWCIIDTIFTIMHPQGVHFLVGGEYILGGKNNKLFYIFIAQILSVYKYYKLKVDNKRLRFMIEWFIFTCLCLVNISIIKSSTTLLIIVLLLAFVLFNKIICRSPLCNPFFVCLFHICLFIIIIFVRDIFQNQLDNLMQLLFNKDATFTGRIYIWRSALVEIRNHLWIGLGRYKDIAAVLKSGNIFMWSMSHNQILEILLRGGICLLIVWIGTVGILIKRLWIFRNHLFSKFATYALFSFFFFFQTEASIEKISFFPMLLLYHIANEVSYLEEI